ncbi:argonaute-like protein [Desarmillaria tabescens]|uniref:Argonaute-like protein n=1 Tax=Armillaria tabescens TaxID=1929756 RepID=A0AA39K8B9_ARMTA|nr:argonaute-like protein [Desarmillaria tabescens]KAK0455295.1 argonaute-like protein [Desarmillaria tabescens]
MAPRKAHGQAGGPTRGDTRRGPPGAGSADAQSSLRGGVADQGTLQTSVYIAPSVEVVGVKRPSYGKEGRLIKIFVNVCKATVPEGMIYQYDVQIYVGDDDKEKKLDISFNRSLFEKMQNDFRDIFTPCAVYDGKKISFASHELDLGPSDKRQFDLMVDNGSDRAPKRFIICLMKSSVVNLEMLKRFTKGLQSYDSEVQKALTALNVVIRMAPSLAYPSHGRSFYMHETRSIGLGLLVCQGYFQSVHPAFDRLLINVDITMGIMYKDGSLISLCLEYLGLPSHQAHQLDPQQGLPPYERIRLQRFLSGMKIVPTLAGSGAHGRKGKPVLVKRLTNRSALMLTFTPHGGGAVTTVAAYFQQQNQLLQYPHIICVETSSGAFIPLEKCEVLPGQSVRKEIPPEATSAIVKFSTKHPNERLAAIKKGVELLQYEQSEYVKAFGFNIKSDSLPLEINARVLPAPKLLCGGKTTFTPTFGSYNMRDKTVYKAASIKEWMIIIYADHSLVSLQDAQKMIKDLIKGCQSVGMTVRQANPLLKFENGAGNISAQLRQAGREYQAKYQCLPELIVTVLSDYGNSGIYNEIKHFGKFKAGVATQCLKAGKCINARMQYWANVALKINPKLDGCNFILTSESSKVMSDPQNATIIMGADVMHPSPGSIAPSYAALVSSIDKLGVKYIAKSSMQTSRQEMISSLRDMAKEAIQSYITNRSNVERITNASAKPKRLIFFRDGVSEGEFEQVLNKELLLLKAACQDAGVNPKITFITVIKRHHIRFFSDDAKDIDRDSGNLIAGTVIDRDITSPVLFNWYLQSHGGLKGTSRSAYYTVLHDESNFNPDALQSLSYVLCYTFARATKSVSIPAPVYYAHIVCREAKQHYDPAGPAVSDAGPSGSTEYDYIMEHHRSEYKPKVHSNQQNVMHWL